MEKAQIVGKGLRVVGKVVQYTGDTPTKKAGTGVAIYGAATLDPLTTGVGLAIRFHDSLDALAAKAKDIVMGAAILKGMVDDANAQVQEETEQQA